MDITKESIKKYMELRGYHGRQYRFKVIEELLNVDSETAKSIEKITRYIRYNYPADDTSIPNQTKTLQDLDYASIHTFADGKLF